jgi:cell division protein FtsZ
MEFNFTDDTSSIIKVIGVGGGGSNAVTHMFKQGIVGVSFAICNTDSQAMEMSPVKTKIQLGPDLTEGRGAGSKPNIGREACVESLEDVRKFLANNTKMLFVTAGMGGGTGTGAAPVIAKAAQEMDILTVGIITLPFTFEGRRRATQAREGLEELKKNVDTLIVISNDKLRQMHGNLVLSAAFANADDILTTAAKGIAEIITVAGYINVDFEDVNTVMRGSGVAIMGTGSAEGENRARKAVEEAISSPLLEENDIRGAQHILLNITSGTREVTMDEIFEITEFVQEEAGYGTDLIWGNCYDNALGEKISVTIIATGFEHNKERIRKEAPRGERVWLDDKTADKKQSQTPTPTTKSKIDLFADDDTNANSITYEFETPKKTDRRTPSFSYEEPYVKENIQTHTPEDEKAKYEEARKNRLQNLSVKLDNPQTINEMENEPAYLRRRVRLDNVQHSSEKSSSKWTISDDDKPELRENNSYLHDNVD